MEIQFWHTTVERAENGGTGPIVSRLTHWSVVVLVLLVLMPVIYIYIPTHLAGFMVFFTYWTSRSNINFINYVFDVYFGKF